VGEIERERERIDNRRADQIKVNANRRKESEPTKEGYASDLRFVAKEKRVQEERHAEKQDKIHMLAILESVCPKVEVIKLKAKEAQRRCDYFACKSVVVFGLIEEH
jgi:hypothetical protein